jgi:hypothetical protein
MKRLIIGLLLSGVVVAPALAADQYTIVKDTVGNCSAVVSTSTYPGMTVVSDKAFGSWEDAMKAIDGVKECNGIVR